MTTEKFTGSNEVLLVLGQRTCAHREDSYIIHTNLYVNFVRTERSER